MGKKGLLIVSLDIDADKEKEFNQFYNEKPLDVSLRIRGYLTGQLFQVFQDMNLSGAVTDAPPDVFHAGKPRKFIVVYEGDFEEGLWGWEIVRREPLQRKNSLSGFLTLKTSPSPFTSQFLKRSHGE